MTMPVTMLNAKRVNSIILGRGPPQQGAILKHLGVATKYCLLGARLLGGSKLTYCSLAVYHRQYRKTIAYRWLDVYTLQ